MPPRRTGFNAYMPQGQRTLTEVDGVVEIGPVGPVTQNELAPAQAHTSRKRDAAEAAAQPAAAQHREQLGAGSVMWRVHSLTPLPPRQQRTLEA